MQKDNCDCCHCEINEYDGRPGLGKLELVCACCSDCMNFCNECERYGKDSEFSYGQEYCDHCADKEADRLCDKE